MSTWPGRTDTDQLELTAEPGWKHLDRLRTALEQPRTIVDTAETIDRPRSLVQGLDSDADDAEEGTT